MACYSNSWVLHSAETVCDRSANSSFVGGLSGEKSSKCVKDVGVLPPLEEFRPPSFTAILVIGCLGSVLTGNVRSNKNLFVLIRHQSHDRPLVFQRLIGGTMSLPSLLSEVGG